MLPITNAQNIQATVWPSMPFAQIAKAVPGSLDVVEINSLKDEKFFFPNGISNLTFEQSNIGNCQSLAGIDALSRNPEGVKILRNMIKQNSDGKSADVYFACMNGKPINVTFDEIEQKKKQEQKEIFGRLKNLVRSKPKDKTCLRPAGIDVIEIAYAKYQKIVYPHLFKNNEVKNVYNNKRYHSSALQFMKDITGLEVNIVVSSDNMKTKHDPPLKMASKERQKEITDIFNDASNNPGKYILTGGTIDNKKALDKKFVRWHDYSVRKVDAQKGLLTIANPWDTSETLDITIEEFMSNFENLTYTKVK